MVWHSWRGLQRRVMGAEGTSRKPQALFEGNDKQAAAYAKNRPSYSREVFDRIYSYAGPAAATDTALDVATGAPRPSARIYRAAFHITLLSVGRVAGWQAADSVAVRRLTEVRELCLLSCKWQYHEGEDSIRELSSAKTGCCLKVLPSGYIAPMFRRAR